MEGMVLNKSDRILQFSLECNYNNEFSLNLKANSSFKEVRLHLGEEVICYSDLDCDALKHTLNKFPPLKDEIYCEVKFFSNHIEKKTCSLTGFYKSKPFESLYTYYGELGAIYNNDYTIFRAWSPISKSIKVRVYECGTPKILDSKLGNDNYNEYEMHEIENGCFECTVNGDLEGKYYTYVVSNYKYKDKEIVDPYTKSCGINGYRGMIVDFSKTNPEGWDSVRLNGKSNEELLVYETHIADLTSSKTWGGNKDNRCLFRGFYEEGTKYTDGGITVSTGFDHIKELGVNTVQLLPIFKHDCDERVGHKVFNWGYDPTYYNSLDGIYSKNPYDGYERIKEFKNLVMAYSKAGINIIMDVVYNHMSYYKDSSFEVLMPEYYFRFKDGVACDGSGCGNETASDKSMFRKFMIDSTEFWAREYKLGGFRFDLMGLHDITTMNLLVSNLKANVNPRITVYGEPWNAGSVDLGIKEACIQMNMNSYVGYGCFNDKLRDSLIKGGICPSDELGWVNEASCSLIKEIEEIKSGIKGKIIPNNSKHDVEKCVNYVTCHDNFTLYDRFKAAGETDEDLIKRMAILAQSVVLTSQGIKFMLAGEEFLRSKNGNNNSYNSTYLENELDYSLKIKNLDIFNIYKRLIKLNNETELFNKDSYDSEEIVVSTSNCNNLIYYDLDDLDNNRIYRIAHRNGYKKQSDLKLSFKGFHLVLDTLGIYNDLEGDVSIKPYQTIIAYKSI